MTIDELIDKYGFEISEARLISGKLHPIYEKHLPACWIIQTVWGHVANGNLSLGKARELTAAIIEEHNNQFNGRTNKTVRAKVIKD